MQLSPLDSLTVTVMLVAGTVMATGGLWMLYRPRQSAERALFQFLGVKVESSSTGLVVFIIGAAFLAVPLFAPRQAPAGRDAASHQEVATEAPDDLAAVTLRRPTALMVEGEEAEPNNSPASANVIPLGAVITGRVASGDPDVFWVEVPDDVTGQLVVNANADDFHLRLLDEAGGQITSQWSGRTATIRQEIDRPGYYVVIEPDADVRGAPYQLTVAARGG